MASQQWAVITGATSGIGRALCDQFAADGVNLIIVSRKLADLKQVADTVEKQFKVSVVPLAIDLSKPEGPSALHEAVGDKQIDYLINNAGFGGYGAFAKSDWAQEQGMINLNIAALTELCKLFLPAMVERGHGRVLNVASTAAFLSGPYMAVYFATKAYVLHFSEALNEELHGVDVRVTALCPGPTSTHFAETAHATNTAIFRGNLPSATEVAVFGYSAMLAGKPVAIHRFKNKLLIFMIRFIPRRTLTKFVGRAQR